MRGKNAAMTDERLAEIERRYKEMMPTTCELAIAELLAEVKRLRTAQQWQPIETAPKDGTVILLGYTPCPKLWETDQRVFEGRWNSLQGEFTSLNGFILHDGATHWMPQPDAPTEVRP